MSQIESMERSSSPRPLWPVAAVILGVVFAPALLAWAISLLAG